MIVSFVQTICKPMFGTFEREEFKKFLRMGLIFSFIIGSYWTMRVLKDAVFTKLVGIEYQPWAKTVSLILLIPTLMIYTKLLDRFSREKTFYILATYYGVATIVFALLMINPVTGMAAPETITARTGIAAFCTKLLGYLFYSFVESYGSLIVALFWAIASDTTLPESAKKGFSLVVAIGQVGGIVGPKYVTKFPRWLNFQTDAVAVAVCAFLTLSLIYLMKRFLTITPKELLTSFHGTDEKKLEQEQEPGFFEGLQLLFKHRYLLSIFGILFFFEFIVTIFDFHFKVLASQVYKGQALSEYWGEYGSAVNLVALICLLLGVSNITRWLGIGIALVLMPLIFTGAVFGFLTFSNLTFLFSLMVGSKAINYALNGPALKQLYIPTTHDVRFKSQAWIETFGSRGSKEAGALFNMTYKPMCARLGFELGRARHVMVSAVISFALIAIWALNALYLGRTYNKAVEEKRTVC